MKAKDEPSQQPQQEAANSGASQSGESQPKVCFILFYFILKNSVSRGVDSRCQLALAKAARSGVRYDISYCPGGRS